MATSTAAGRTGFAARDWILVAVVAALWGSSFLLIKVGVHDLAPATVAWLRLLFGAAALSLVPAARQPLRRRADRGRVALLGVIWMAVPFVLFPLAEQSISSALAGMINGATPLFTAVIAACWARRLPGRSVTAGLAVGFVGVLAVNLPAARGGASVAGIVMVLAAALCYGVAFNLAEPLETRNGPLPVIFRAMVVALVAETPAGIVGFAESTPTVSVMLAMLVLGALCTGAAFVAFTTLVGRVGASRASVTVYIVPVVAIVLGVTVRGEPIAALSLAGIALVLLGAYLTGRRSGTSTPESL
ncbi:MAG TPA: DMT family transporter [Streptomyces sp.]|nr:DMT family transporter [Streptomyces sp.]